MTEERIRIGLAAEILDLNITRVRRLHQAGKLSGTKNDKGALQFTLTDLYAYNRVATARRADAVLGWMTQTEAAVYLQLHRRQFVRLADEGRFPRDDHGRVARETIEELLAQDRTAGAVLDEYDLIPTDEVLADYGIRLKKLYDLRAKGALVPTKRPGDRKLYYSRATLDEIFRDRRDIA